MKKPPPKSLTLTVIDDSPVLSATAKLVYRKLMNHFNFKTKECFPSEETMAREAGRSTRTIRAGKKELREYGVITTVLKKWKGRKWALTWYDLKPETETGATLGLLYDIWNGIKSVKHMPYRRKNSPSRQKNSGTLVGRKLPTNKERTLKSKKHAEPTLLERPAEHPINRYPGGSNQQCCRHCKMLLSTVTEYEEGIHAECKEREQEDAESAWRESNPFLAGD